MVYLGFAFEKGLGIKAGTYRAIDWYDRAAKRGCLLAKMFLGGVLVEAGRYDDARRVLSDKSLKDDAPSMYWLARLSVLEKDDYEDAQRLLEKASIQKHIPSQRMLGGILLSGRSGLAGIPRGLWLCIKSVAAALKVAIEDRHSPRLRN